MDVREIRTHKLIKESFQQLLKEKKYSDITIQNILDMAQIGRSTFYSHYKSKDDVCKALCKDIFTHLKNPNHEVKHDFTGDKDFLHTIMHMLHHFSEDKELLNTILKSEGRLVFLDSLKMHLSMLIKENMMPYYKSNTIPDALILNHLSATLMEIVLWWITKDGCIETPENVAYYYFALVMPILEQRKR